MKGFMAAAAMSAGMALLGGCSLVAELNIVFGQAPIAHWGFEDTGSVVLDQTLNGNNGQLRGGNHVAGVLGQALQLNGIDQWVEVSDSSTLQKTSVFTIEAWVKPSAYSTGGIANAPGIVSYGKQEQGMWELRMLDEGQIYLLLNWNTTIGETAIISPPVLQLDRWQHVAATFNGSTARVYHDGLLVAQGAADALVHPGSGTYLAIGNDFPGRQEFFSGAVDEVWLYGSVIPTSKFHFGATAKGSASRQQMNQS